MWTLIFKLEELVFILKNAEKRYCKSGEKVNQRSCKITIKPFDLEEYIDKNNLKSYE